MGKHLLSIAAGLALAIAVPSIVLAQQTSTTYLADGDLDMNMILAPAPQGPAVPGGSGDPRYETDRSIFGATRALIGGDRWDLAKKDVDYNAGWMTEAFSCALGVKIEPAKAPRLMTLIDKATATANALSAGAKQFFKRDRPFIVDPTPDSKLCQPRSELTTAGKLSYDYPSGHTTSGWTWALVLAELAPDRATAVLKRGHAYGESWIVCGVHNYSAIEAGRVTASATFAAEHLKPAFLVDLGSAKTELDALRADPATIRPDPGKCAAEADLIGRPIVTVPSKSKK